MSAASTGVPAAVRTSRPGKAVLDQTLLDQTGAAASPALQAISANCRHDLAPPLANMTVLSWGDNAAGQPGNGTTSACHNAGLSVSIPRLPTAPGNRTADPAAWCRAL
jgi:hypothetical protein